MKNTVLIFILLFSITLTSGQSVPNWEWGIKGEAARGFALPAATAIDDDGNIFVGVSFIREFILSDGVVKHRDDDYMPGIYKLAPDGTLLWNLDFEGNSGSSCTDIELDAEGNAYVTVNISGSITIDGQEYSGGSHYNVIFSLSPLGEFRWVKSIFGQDISEITLNEEKKEITFTNSHLGKIEWGDMEYYTGPTTFNTSILAIGFDGEPTWLKEMLVNTSQFCLAKKSDDGYFVLIGSDDEEMSLYDTDEIIAASKSPVYHIFSFNKDWDLNWRKEFESDKNEEDLYISGFEVVNGSELVLAGTAIGDVMYESDTIELGANSLSCPLSFIFKLTSDGELKTYHKIGSGRTCDIVYGLYKGTDDRLYLTGTSSKTFKIEEDEVLMPNGGAFIMKFRTDLSYIWNITAKGNAGKARRVFIADLALNQQNDLIATGSITSGSVEFGDEVLKYESDGNPRTVFITKVENDWNAAVDNLVNPSQVQIFPNPSKGNISIQTQSTDVSIFVRDITGRLLDHISKTKTYNFSYSLPEAKGMYFLTVIYKDGSSTIHKVVKD